MSNDFLQQIIDNPLAAVADYYASCLAEHSRAVDFIADEFKLSLEQATEKRFGFSDRSLGNQIPPRRIKAGRQVRELLTSLGLYKANGRETQRGRVTQPIVDDSGNIVGIRGYKIDPHGEGESVIVVGETGDRKEAAVQNAAAPTTDRATEIKNESNNDDPLMIEENQITLTRDDRVYRIRGLERNKSTCKLQVRLMVSRDSLVHLDSLDLVKARSRASFIKAAATELYVDAEAIKQDIGTLLLKLETLQAERIAELKQPAKAAVTMSDNDQSEAMELLNDPKLLQRIAADLDACGLAGESTNKLAGYLAATSRKLDRPLAIVIQSSSSAGKTSVMDGILSMVPDEEQLRLSNLTAQSLYYLESDDIRHKILAISEDNGIGEATYALKLLQSEGVLRHAAVSRDETGEMKTKHNTVEGPTQIFLTTTASELDEELMNRFLVLTVDETRDQTKAIHDRQKTGQTVAGQLRAQRAARIKQLHHNAQRLLRQIDVYNPYADQLTFPDNRTRLRRDFEKYLTLIRSIALLHQHQRKIHRYESIEYINVEPSDIRVANGMAGEILGRSLDERSPQTRNLLMKLHEFVGDLVKQQDLPRSAIRFTRRDVREPIGWSDFQLHKHLSRLVDLEYLLVHRGRQGRRFVYELLYDGKGREGEPFLAGLIDPAKLQEPAPIPASLSPC